MKEQIGWIDFLKGVSIFAVIMDHLYNIVYFNSGLHLFTGFSVSLFIFLAGITSVISLQRNKKPLKLYQLKKVKGILIPYVIASLVYSLIVHDFHFNLGVFWREIITFSASTPFYFILLFLQLILIAPYLYHVIVNKHIIFQLLSIVPAFFISKYLSEFTAIDGVFGGGGRILGGTYFFLFHLGMVFYLIYKNHYKMVDKIWINVIAAIISTSSLYLIHSTGALTMGWSNPPNKFTIWFTISVFVLGYSIYSLITKYGLGKMFSKVVEYLGKQSYYIYLYHSFAIHIAWIISIKLAVNEGILKFVLFISFALLLPLLISIATKRYTKLRFEKYHPINSTTELSR